MPIVSTPNTSQTGPEFYRVPRDHVVRPPLAHEPGTALFQPGRTDMPSHLNPPDTQELLHITQLSSASTTPRLAEDTKQALNMAITNAIRGHNDYGSRRDMLHHRGKMGGNNAINFLRDVHTALHPDSRLAEQTGDGKIAVTDDVVTSTLADFLAVIPQLDTDTVARRDTQIKAIAVAHMTFKKAIAESGKKNAALRAFTDAPATFDMTNAQANRFARAAVTLAGRVDANERSHFFMGEFRHAAMDMTGVLVEPGGHGWVGFVTASYVYAPLTIAPVYGAIESIRRLATREDKPSNHAIRLATKAIEKITVIEQDTLNDIIALMRSVGTQDGNRIKQFRDAVHQRATPGQRNQIALG